MKKAYRSEALGAVHETASDLHDAGLMDKRKLRKFNELCLTPVRPTSDSGSGEGSGVHRLNQRCRRNSRRAPSILTH